MTINDVLDCFNKVLEESNSPIFYKAHTNWVRKIGAVKEINTIITEHGLFDKKNVVIDTKTTINTTDSDMSPHILNNQKEAIKEFIKYWYNDTRTE